MGKPGALEHFNSRPIDIDEFTKNMHLEIDGFTINMKDLPIGKKKLTSFEWFYTFGFWSEALEFRDEFPEYFEEWA